MNKNYSRRRILAIKQLPVTTVREHRFQMRIFTNPRFCSYCLNIIYGAGIQGESCMLCGCAFHAKCLKQVNFDCPRFTIKNNSLNKLSGNPHTFSLHTYIKDEFCYHCGHIIYGVLNQGYKCNNPICGVSVHEFCIHYVDDLCGLDELRGNGEIELNIQLQRLANANYIVYIDIKRAKNLALRTCKAFNIYCILYAKDMSGHINKKQIKYKTETHKNRQDPYFNESIIINYQSKNITDTFRLHVEVWHYIKCFKHQYVGGMSFSMEELKLISKQGNLWYKLLAKNLAKFANSIYVDEKLASELKKKLRQRKFEEKIYRTLGINKRGCNTELLEKTEIQKTKISFSPKDEDKDDGNGIINSYDEQNQNTPSYDRKDCSVDSVIDVSDINFEEASISPTIPRNFAQNESGKGQSFDIPSVITKPASDNNASQIMSICEFSIIRNLGRGGFSNVVLAEYNNNIFAIKVLHKTVITKLDVIANIFEERKILIEGQCPFFPRLFAAFQDDENLYLVMDFVDGGDLLFHLMMDERFEENRGYFYAAETFLAINYLHQRSVIYRDIKLDNLLLDTRGHVKLVDFGLCKVLKEGEKTNTFCGSEGYMAPEVREHKPYDRSADLWSYGVLIFEMLTGTLPYMDKTQDIQKATTEPHYPEYLTPSAKDLIAKLMRKNPDMRISAKDSKREELMKHSFFRDIDWLQLYQQKITPPYRPEYSHENIRGNFKTRNITTLNPKDTLVVDDNLFEGFDY